MTLWLTAAFVLAVFVSVGATEAQPPGKKGGPPDKFGGKDGQKKKGKGKGSRITTDGVADYLLSFDIAKTGKVTREQLPERMQDLVDQGDTNKDGALDREEILALAAKLSEEPRPRQFNAKGFGKKKFQN
jgi:hypothetical protein